MDVPKSAEKPIRVGTAKSSPCYNCNKVGLNYHMSNVRHHWEGQKESLIRYCSNCIRPYTLVTHLTKGSGSNSMGEVTRYYNYIGVIAGQNQYTEVNENGSLFVLEGEAGF